MSQGPYLVYMASAIDKRGHTHTTNSHLLDHVKKEAKKHEIDLVIFAPFRAFVMGNDGVGFSSDAARSLMDINNAAIMNASIMLVFDAPDIESWGVPQEVLLAHYFDVPVLLVSERSFDDLPTYAKALVNSRHVFPDVSSAVAAIPATWIVHGRLQEMDE